MATIEEKKKRKRRSLTRTANEKDPKRSTRGKVR
jgi:hypothetical protein